MSTAIYALSADPITHGHMDIVGRALRVFDRLVIGIGNNSAKRYLFTLEERAELTKIALKGLGEDAKRVDVQPFEGLLVDYAYQQGIETIVRGVRNGADFEYERMLHDINYGQRMGVDTVVIMSDQSLSHVSSSAVKELVSQGANDVLDYVCMPVKVALEQRIMKQVRVMVTGEIGAGKSHLCDEFVTHLRDSRTFNTLPSQYPKTVGHLDLDVVGRQVITKSKDPFCVDIRRVVSRRLGVPLLSTGMLNLKKVMAVVLASPDHRRWFNDAMRDPIKFYLRKELLQKDRIFLIGTALAVEAEALGIANNHIILVKASMEERVRRLKERGYSDEEIDLRMNAQMDADSKRRRIKEEIKYHGCGDLLVLDNTDTDYASTLNNLMRMKVWLSKFGYFLP